MNQIIIFIMLFLLLVTGCTKQTDQQDVSKNISNKNTSAHKTKVVVGSIGDASKLLPLMAGDSASSTISSLVFNGLVKYDNNLNLIGDLAETFEMSDDCIELNFKLKEGVKWHDGKELTSEDVLFTYQTLINPKVASPYKGDFEVVEKMEIIDDYRIKVTYKKPFAPAVSSWGMGIIPKHLLENEDINTTQYNRSPIGTGPYKIETWDTGSKIVLSANKNYFEKTPGIDKYIYRIIPDSATMFLELKTANIDSMTLEPIQYRRQTDTDFFKKRFIKYNYPDFSYTYVGYNFNNPRFADKKVRRALTHAIDKNAIIDGVMMGLGKPATGPLPPESWAYNKNVQTLEYDLEKSKRLLAEAGWKDSDNDGIIDKDGLKFSFTLLTNQGNAKRAKAAEIIQQNLKQVGIEVNIRILEWQSLLHQFIDPKKFDAVIIGWALGRDPDMYDIFHSSKVAKGEFNFVSYNNKRVDELLAAGRQTCNKDERKNIYHEIHSLIAEDQPYTFLYYPDSLPILEKRFKGVNTGSLGIWYNFKDWYVPVDKTKWY